MKRNSYCKNETLTTCTAILNTIDSRSNIRGIKPSFFMPYDKNGKYYRNPVYKVEKTR